MLRGEYKIFLFFLSSRRRHTRCALVTGVQTCALPISPLFHVTAEIPVFLQSFALGRKLVLMPKWNADEAMRLIQDEKCNYFVGVPLMSYEILVSPNRKNYDLSTCKSYAGGGAPRPPEHVRRQIGRASCRERVCQYV